MKTRAVREEDEKTKAKEKTENTQVNREDYRVRKW